MAGGSATGRWTRRQFLGRVVAGGMMAVPGWPGIGRAQGLKAISASHSVSAASRGAGSAT